VVSFTTWQLYPRRKNPQYPLDRRLGGPQSRSGRRGEKKILTLPGLELRTLGRPARNPVAVSNALSRLLTKVNIFTRAVREQLGASRTPTKKEHVWQLLHLPSCLNDTELSGRFTSEIMPPSGQCTDLLQMWKSVGWLQVFSNCSSFLLFTSISSVSISFAHCYLYNFTYFTFTFTLLTYGAKPFLRICQLCSHSENSQQF
jgi:hypothetical protein